MARLRTSGRRSKPRPSAATVQSVQRRIRVQNLVGRDREIGQFTDLLAAERAPCIIYLHGPGGIGKSSLLEAFRICALEQGHSFDGLDARLLPARPDAVRQAVEQALAGPRP